MPAPVREERLDDRIGRAPPQAGGLEDRARTLGYTRLVLETGTKQPEAIALYESDGYTSIPAYGYYRDAPNSRCYAKDLAG